MRRFIASLLALLASNVFACVEYQASGTSGSNKPYTVGPFPTYAEVCEAVRGFQFGASGNITVTNAIPTQVDEGGCTFNLTYVITGSQTGGTSQSYIPIQKLGDGAACAPRPPTTRKCESGKTRSMNVTVGYGTVSGFTSDGRAIVKTPSSATGASPDTLCDAGCSMVADGGPTETWVSKEPSTSGMHRASNDQNYMDTGGSCTPSQADKDALTPGPGTCTGTFGYVNGKPTCLAGSPTASSPGTASKSLGTTDAKGQTVNAKNPDGSAGATGPNGEVPGKGTDVAGSPAVASSNPPVAATPNKSSTEGTSTGADFCRDNPQSFTCQSSSFAGSCEGGFTCGGDAALCAVARGSWEARCALRSVETDPNSVLSKIGNDAANGLDPSEHPSKNRTTVDVGGFNQTNPFSASCPADVHIAGVGIVQGFDIPLSAFCSVFQMIGQLMVAVTMLACAVWVVRV